MSLYVARRMLAGLTCIAALGATHLEAQTAAADASNGTAAKVFNDLSGKWCSRRGKQK